MRIRCECQCIMPMRTLTIVCAFHSFTHLFSPAPSLALILDNGRHGVNCTSATTVIAAVAADAVNSAGERMRSPHSIINMTRALAQRDKQKRVPTSLCHSLGLYSPPPPQPNPHSSERAST